MFWALLDSRFRRNDNYSHVVWIHQNRHARESGHPALVLESRRLQTESLHCVIAL